MATPRAKRKTGWYKLPSGHPYYGTIPEGAKEIQAPKKSDDSGSSKAKA